MQIIYVLQWTDMSSSLSGEEEHVDSLIFASANRGLVEAYVSEQAIKLGVHHLYHQNYECYTIVEVGVTQ